MQRLSAGQKVGKDLFHRADVIGVVRWRRDLLSPGFFGLVGFCSKAVLPRSAALGLTQSHFSEPLCLPNSVALKHGRHDFPTSISVQSSAPLSLPNVRCGSGSYTDMAEDRLKQSPRKKQLLVLPSLLGGVCRFTSSSSSTREILLTTQETPNPNARKFVWQNQDFLPAGAPDSVSYNDKAKCKSSPLAKKLLEVAGVNSVLLARKHITIVKARDARWSYVEKFVMFEITNHLENSLPVYMKSDGALKSKGNGESTPNSAGSPSSAGRLAAVEGNAIDGGGEDTDDDDAEDDSDDEDDEDVVESIKAHLDTRARPLLQQDGGDLEFIRFDKEEGIVYLYLKGSCEGCPSSSVTLRFGIKGMLQHYVPQVKDVIQCDENGDLLDD